VLTATSTLAAGVNLPVRRVVFRQHYIGLSDNRIDPTRYRQMVGGGCDGGDRGIAGVQGPGAAPRLLAAAQPTEGAGLTMRCPGRAPLPCQAGRAGRAGIDSCGEAIMLGDDAIKNNLLQLITVRRGVEVKERATVSRGSSLLAPTCMLTRAAGRRRRCSRRRCSGRPSPSRAASRRPTRPTRGGRACGALSWRLSRSAPSRRRRTWTAS
jgi:hypothetical protein